MGIEITSSTKWPSMNADEVREAKQRIASDIIEKMSTMVDWALVNHDLLPAKHPLRCPCDEGVKSSDDSVDFDWMESNESGFEVMTTAMSSTLGYGTGVAIVPMWLLHGGTAGGAVFHRRCDMQFPEPAVRVITRYTGIELSDTDEAEYDKRKSCCSANNGMVGYALVRNCSLRRLEEFSAFLDLAYTKMRSEVLGEAIGEAGMTGLVSAASGDANGDQAAQQAKA